MTFVEEWTGLAGVFGGRVVAELAAAAERATATEQSLEGMELVSLVAEFTAAVDPGAAEVSVDVVHAGRRTASVAAAIHQGRLRASARAKLVRGVGVARLPRRAMDDVPPPEVVPVFDVPYPVMPYLELTEVRVIDHATVHGQPATRAWVRLRDDAPAVAELTDAGHAAVLLDVVPPGPFFSDDEVGFVPTLDFALHRTPGVSARGWFLAEGRTEWWSEGFCAESTVLWTADGRHVARATQNRRVLRG